MMNEKAINNVSKGEGACGPSRAKQKALMAWTAKPSISRL